VFKGLILHLVSSHLSYVVEETTTRFFTFFLPNLFFMAISVVEDETTVLSGKVGHQ